MKNKKSAITIASIPLLIASLLVLLGCKKGSVELPLFDGARAYAEVEQLVQISPRDAGTPNGRKAAEHIFQRMKSFGVQTEIDTFTDKTPNGMKTMHNVVGRIPGKTDRWIILGSHFDTMPGVANFKGANDSGSSTGILLETARVLAKQKPETGIIFAFFDGEEGIAGYGPDDGLHGSRRMAGQLVEANATKTIKAMVLLDMVGDADLGFTIPNNSSMSMVKAVLDAATEIGCRDYFTLARQTIIIDDHQPFLNVGIPAIVIIDFHFGSEPGLNDYWHTEDDNLAHISVQSLEITGNILYVLLKNLVPGT